MCGSKQTETEPIVIQYYDPNLDKFKKHAQFNLEKGITMEWSTINLNIHNLKDFIKEHKIDPSEFKIREMYDNSGYYEKCIIGGHTSKPQKYHITLYNNEDILLFPFSRFHLQYCSSYCILEPSLNRTPAKCEILEYLKHCKGKWTLECETSLLDLPFLGLGLLKVDKGEKTRNEKKFIGVVEDNGDDEMVVIGNE